MCFDPSFYLTLETRVERYLLTIMGRLLDYPSVLHQILQCFIDASAVLAEIPWQYPTFDIIRCGVCSSPLAFTVQLLKKDRLYLIFCEHGNHKYVFYTLLV